MLRAFWPLAALPLLGLSGCFFGATQRIEPAEPIATPAPDSDFVLVRTRDQNHYYLIDAARGACFLHTRLYGREHLVQVDCHSFPGYEKVLADDAARRGPRPDPEAAALETVPPAPDPSAEAPSAPVVGDDEERPEDQSFRRAWVVLACSQRQGAEEPLEVVLERFQLQRDAWDQGVAALSEDDKAALAEDVDAACPPESSTP